MSPFSTEKDFSVCSRMSYPQRSFLMSVILLLWHESSVVIDEFGSRGFRSAMPPA
ncbi:Uu.00g012040.m01.CDS01 [Anthostomella pinea]|uniref:Uu.00g012040.m01.CDS01 n=1 Tax=Anthostomella pinea TaxID=933095 RepID=A0AAI8YQ74_9PEZI|nr:Uu.00g012040.m01.CDS01 [Anthostomella pinea]